MLPTSTEDIPPAPDKDPVFGPGGIEYLEWAAAYLSDLAFRHQYIHLAGDLLIKHDAILSAIARERLESVAENQTAITLASILYDRYCAAVGGLAFNGDPLPGWIDFHNDESKRKQSEAWIAVASEAIAALT